MPYLNFQARTPNNKTPKPQVIPKAIPRLQILSFVEQHLDFDESIPSPIKTISQIFFAKLFNSQF